MKKTLKISATRSLPLDTVTQAIAILGVRGSGKTNTGVDIAEEMLKADQQIVVLDPVDVWWGLRSSRDGKSEGIPITIIGGDHGDVPLEAASGAVIADFVVDSGTSVVLALRHLSMNDQRRFAADFAERLYHRKGNAEFRGPLHLFVDECDEFIPQNIPKGGERMFGAFDRLVRRGRSSGIGITMISQRPQVVNKSVLSQCETLICHRLLHKLDRGAVDVWVSAHDTEGHRDTFMNSLASLDRGTAWLWSPAWLGIFEKVAMRQRETFDSSATPEAGAKQIRPKQVAVVDLNQLRSQLKSTIEKAEAEDPKKLKAQIAQLKAEAAKRNTVSASVDTTALRSLQKENDRYKKQIGSVNSDLFKLRLQVEDALQNVKVLITDRISKIEGLFPDAASVSVSTEKPLPFPVRKVFIPNMIPKESSRPSVEGNTISTAMQKILDAMAKLEACGVSPAPRVQVAFFAGYSNVKSGGFAGPCGQLAEQGYITTGSGNLTLTDLGHKVTAHIDTPGTTSALHGQLYSILSNSEGKLLRLIIEAYPDAISRQELADAAGYGNVKSGGFAGPLGRLTALGLAEVPQAGFVVGTSLLFLD